jgi:hypothetical protein
MAHASHKPRVFAPTQRLADEPLFDFGNFPTHPGSSEMSHENDAR